MAITGIDTIEGKQIIAAGAVSAKSAEMAYKDENGNPITGYQVAGDYYSASNPSGFITGVDLTPYQTTAGMTAYQPAGDYLTTADSANFYTTANESGFITGVDLTPYQLTADMTAYQPIGDYQPSGDYYSASNPSGFISEVPAGTMNESAFGYDASNNITAYNGSAIGGGSAPTYSYTDNDLISAIDTSGLYATSGSASHLNQGATMGANIIQNRNASTFYYMPIISPWTTADVATGIFSPLQYTTGACLGMNDGYFKAYFKGNEWFVGNTAIGQMLRGETHNSRGVHISGATTAGYGFNLGIFSVSGVNSTGSWKYGPAEDAALRAVSSCDMHESAFEYDANDKISGYNGSAFAGGSDVPEGVMVESGLEYNAVNEISAYNGSAIAQYGAEKQFIVHDDTLVHLSNSAQYALGCNISALQRLMGIDETVLFNSTTSAGVLTANLSEPLSSFNTIEVYSNRANAGALNLIGYTKFKTDYMPEFISIMGNTRAGNNETYLIYELFGVSQTALTYISGTNLRVQNTTLTVLNSPNFANAGITKIVGIGRKS